MLDFANFALLVVTLFTVVLLVVVMLRVAKMISGRGAAAKRDAESRGKRVVTIRCAPERSSLRPAW